jgi:transposase
MPSREALTAVLQTAQKVIEDQATEILHLRKQLFGRRSEKVLLGQKSLFVEALETVALKVPEPEPEPGPETQGDEPKPKKRRQERSKREPLKPTRTEEILVADEDRPCPECGEPRCTIGHKRSLVVEFIPAKIEVTEIVRETVACRACEGEVARAPASELPAREGAWPGPNLLATIIINKLADGLPLQRTRKILKRAGGDFAISTLSRWEGFAHEMLKPLADRIAELVRGADVINLDDTSLRVRDASVEGGVVSGKIWVYSGRYFDPGGDLSKTIEHVAYAYAPTWEAKHPEIWLEGSTAILQGDAYRGYERIASAERGDKIGRLLAGCCMHARRPFVQALEVGDAAARPFIEGFQKIYRFEEEAKMRHLLAGERLEFRQEKSLPIMQALRDRAQDLSSMPLLKPVRQGVTYLVNQWDKLVVPFDQDGRLEIDNGLAERRLRRVASGRKAWLFAGSRGGAERFASMLSIVSSADAAGVDAGQYLPSIIEHIDAWPQRHLDQLLPIHWRAALEQAIVEKSRQ